MRFLFSTIVALAASVLDGPPAQAQTPGRPAGPAARSPAFSPYLNLLRQGNSPGVNYYGLVRPQVENRSSLRSLQGQITDNRQAIANQATTANAALPDTGDKTVSFLDTGGYFMNLSPQGGRGGFGTANPAGAGARGAANQSSSRSRGASPPARR